MNELEKKSFYINITSFRQSQNDYFSSRLMQLVALKKGYLDE